MVDQQTPHRYDARLASEIELRWQGEWQRSGAMRVPNPGEPGFDASKPKFYVLDMFPYPSGAGLHVGHPEGYTATDILSRYKVMRGFQVLHPMGWDAFGLPAEQYAIATGVHPEVTTKKAIDSFRRQLQRFGFMYDWSREFATIDPDYYRWTQWIWLLAYGSWFDPVARAARPIEQLESLLASEDRMIETAPGVHTPWSDCTRRQRQAYIDLFRLAYLGTQTVNWCPKLGTVLANEEIIDGRSERGGHPVVRMPLRQWMFRITAYADRLLADLATVDWPDSTRTMQTEWIGRSEGAEIHFVVEGEAEPLTVFTTRPDTIFGATYMVVAPEHPLVQRAIARGTSEEVAAYVAWARNRSDVERQESKKKSGVATGLRAVNPATGASVPIWTADYVLMGYGTGAIMAVPAHDERDFEFAQAFKLPIVQVVEIDGVPWSGDAATTGEGTSVNSTSRTSGLALNGMRTAEAKRAVIAWLEGRGAGALRVQYRLRDWLFSRQRYWGEPFPVVFDADGNHYPVGVAALPVRLPPLADYNPIESDTPQPPLAKARDWVRTTAGEAGVDPALLPAATPVTRETNTMPGWAGSCWYYLRYCSPRCGSAFVDPAAERYWMGKSGVDLYVGGSEHAVLHLLYARFWHKMLFDLGHVSTPEPMARLFHQGMITSYAYQRADRSLVPVDEVDDQGDGTFTERANGERVVQIVAKMSKSLRNVVNPDDVIAEYGADTFRLYEMYMGPLEASKPWNTRDIAGVFRFLQRVWRLAIDERDGSLLLARTASADVERQLARTIHKVGNDIERLAFNTAIASLIELVNAATRPTEMKDSADGGLTRSQLERFLRVLAPFAPHLAEELWQRLGESGSVCRAQWPTVDASLLEDHSVELPVQVQGKVRARIVVPANADAGEVERIALADDKVQALLGGKAPRKVIVVPRRMVNLVLES
jgi:leucyl-tRNA synthetase